METIALSAWMQSMLEERVPAWKEMGLEVVTRVEANLCVSAEETHLRALAEALLEHAQSFARPGSKIRVKLAWDGRSHCRLSVTNVGASPERPDLIRAFASRYRIDPSAGDGGFGDALHRAVEASALCHARLWAESEDGVVRVIARLKVANPKKLFQRDVMDSYVGL